MSWFSEFAGKAENFLNKIDQKTANVLNTSNDLISNKINDDNEFVISSNQSIANSQSLPQLKSIFVSTDPANEFNDFKSDFKYGHSRDSSIASYHGLTMKDTSTSNKTNKFTSIKRTIDDGQLFDYLNNKEDLNSTDLNNHLIVPNGVDKSSHESLRNGVRLNDSSFRANHSYISTDKNNGDTSNDLPSIAALPIESRQNQSETIKAMLKEEKRKLNELKNEYKQHTQSLNNEITFLKDKLDEHLMKKDLRGELDNVKEQLKMERGNKEKFEKEISILSTSFSSLKSEFEEYKVRAQRTLQSKDTLIEQLQKQQSNHENNQSSDSKLEGEYQILLATNQRLQQELQEIRFDCIKSKEEINAFVNERNDLQSQLKQYLIELNNFRASKNQLEDELSRFKMMYEQSQTEFSRLKSENQLIIEEKQQQINELNSQISSSKESKWSQQGIPQDLELKIKNLTENLLNKQTLVEHLKREKNSLSIQLEESKRQMCNLQNKNSNYYINFKDGLSERNRSEALNSESPYNTPVAHRVRKAYSQLDQFSHQIAYFIRAYPLARKLLFGYVIFLHFFVFFILFSSKPEV